MSKEAETEEKRLLGWAQVPPHFKPFQVGSWQRWGCPNFEIGEASQCAPSTRRVYARMADPVEAERAGHVQFDQSVAGMTVLRGYGIGENPYPIDNPLGEEWGHDTEKKQRFERLLRVAEKSKNPDDLMGVYRLVVFDKKAGEQFGPERSAKILHWLAKSKYTPTHLLPSLVAMKIERIDLGLAKNKNLPAEYVAEFARRPSGKVHWAALSHPSLPIAVARDAIKEDWDGADAIRDGSFYERRGHRVHCLLKNRSLSGDLIREIAGIATAADEEVIWWHDNTPPDVRLRLFGEKNDRPKPRRGIIGGGWP